MSPTADDRVAELHAAVRSGPSTSRINLPYVDLMFAFGYATLSDRPRGLPEWLHRPSSLLGQPQ